MRGKKRIEEEKNQNEEEGEAKRREKENQQRSKMYCTQHFSALRISPFIIYVLHYKN